MGAGYWLNLFTLKLKRTGSRRARGLKGQPTAEGFEYGDSWLPGQLAPVLTIELIRLVQRLDCLTPLARCWTFGLWPRLNNNRIRLARKKVGAKNSLQHAPG